MPNKKIALILFIQALLIVILFWMLTFYGKDEYEAFQSNQDEEEIESPNRVSSQDGVNTVEINRATQLNTGIQTSKVKPATFLGEIKTFGTVVPIDALIDAQTQYVNLKSDLTIAKSASRQNKQQYLRLKALNDDDKNVSDRVVQEALALVNADNAKIVALEAQIKQLEASIQLQWGDALSSLLKGNDKSQHLSNLLNRKNMLVQVSLPLHIDTPKVGSVIQITPLTGNIQAINATYISEATKSDLSGYGKTFFYSAPADYLRIGMRVNVETDPNANDNKNGVVIPNSAVVWHGGEAWVYVKKGNHQFVRKPIATNAEINEGWFNQSIKADTEIVTSGAQLLLSEEFKFLIKNENDD